MVSHVPWPVKLQMPDHSRDMLIQKIVENITFVSKESLANMVVQLVQYSKLAIQTGLVTAKIQKTYPAGKTLSF